MAFLVMGKGKEKMEVGKEKMVGVGSVDHPWLVLHLGLGRLYLCTLEDKIPGFSQRDTPAVLWEVQVA